MLTTIRGQMSPWKQLLIPALSLSILENIIIIGYSLKAKFSHPGHLKELHHILTNTNEDEIKRRGDFQLFPED